MFTPPIRITSWTLDFLKRRILPIEYVAAKISLPGYSIPQIYTIGGLYYTQRINAFKELSDIVQANWALSKKQPYNPSERKAASDKIKEMIGMDIYNEADSIAACAHKECIDQSERFRNNNYPAYSISYKVNDLPLNEDGLIGWMECTQPSSGDPFNFLAAFAFDDVAIEWNCKEEVLDFNKKIAYGKEPLFFCNKQPCFLPAIALSKYKDTPLHILMRADNSCRPGEPVFLCVPFIEKRIPDFKIDTTLSGLWPDFNRLYTHKGRCCLLSPERQYEFLFKIVREAFDIAYPKLKERQRIDSIAQHKQNKLLEQATKARKEMLAMQDAFEHKQHKRRKEEMQLKAKIEQDLLTTQAAISQMSNEQQAEMLKWLATAIKEQGNE